MNVSIRRVLALLFVAQTSVMIGCARTSTVPLDAATIEITVRVATICSAADADRMAHRQAAVETIRRGFEGFIVLDSVGGDHLADYPPSTARTNPYGNSAATIFSEDAPLLGHHRVLTVQMLHAGQDESGAAVSARAALGSDWEALVAKGAPATCLGKGG